MIFSTSGTTVSASPAQKDTIRVVWFAVLLSALSVIFQPLVRLLVLLPAVTIIFVRFVVALGRNMATATLIVICGGIVQMQNVVLMLKASGQLKARKRGRLFSMQAVLDGRNY